MRELTFRAVAVGVVLSLAMVAANTYLGLKVGMTISANIPCSVIALILFHTVLRTRSIAEVNIAQATGSVGEGMAAGVIFVFPALVLAGAFAPFAEWGLAEFTSVTVAVLAGSVLGVVLTGFLRRPMVVESRELKFPEGVATAEILKTGMAAFGEGRREGMAGVVFAFLGGLATKVLSSGVAVMQEGVSAAFRVGDAAVKLGSDLSAALVGVGFIIEFNGAALVALGGALAWLVFIPAFTAMNPDAGAAADVAEAMWADRVRYIGVGGMIVGGIWSILQTRTQIAAGIRSALAGLAGPGHRAGGERSPLDVDLPRSAIVGLIAVGMGFAVAVYFTNVGLVGAFIATVYTALAVFFFVAISVYIVGLIGSTNQPVSGITICTFLLAALFLFLGQVAGAEAVKALLLISGVVCLAACLSGTASQNFKTALLVEGTPRAVQAGLLVAVVVTAFLAAPLMVFLDGAFGIGGDGRLLAPQASMFAAMAKGLFVEGAALPWDMVGFGLVLGVVLIGAGQVLKAMGSSFGISPMAVAVGIYLPFTTTLPILLGGLVHLAVTRRFQGAALALAVQTGTVLAAGLVAGEALTGIVLAVPIGLGAKLPHAAIPWEALRVALSVLVLLGLPLLLWRGIRDAVRGQARGG